ncbi:MAG: ribosome maturation factor RimM [Pseudomonadota bacterium]
MLEKPVLLARIGAPHGVRGEVRVKSFTDDPLSFSSYGPLHAKDGTPFVVVDARIAKSVVIVRFENITTREAAEALNGTELFADRSTLPQVEDEDEFYADDLAGLSVLDQDGNRFGTVRALHDFGAGDIIEIDLTNGGQELFAFTREIFPKVDVGAGNLVIDPPGSVSERDRDGLER